MLDRIGVCNEFKKEWVNGMAVWSAEISLANTLRVEAGTTGYRGGDAGHGGRSYFRIKDQGDTGIIQATANDEGIEFCVGGDSELDTLIAALEFITEALKDGRRRIVSD